MAKLVAKNALDMLSLDSKYSDSQDTTLGDHDANHFVATSDAHTYTFTGSGFMYSMIGDQTVATEGTVHGLSISGDAGTDLTVTRASAGVTTIENYVANGDWTGLETYVFRNNDTINGSRHDDRLSGFGGSDHMSGGNGNDVLDGGAKADVLTGGSGNDQFQFDQVSDSTGKNFDRITDFNTDGDRIALGQSIGHLDAPVDYTGPLTTSAFDADLSNALGKHQLHAHDAVLLTVDENGDTMGPYNGHTFLVIDGNGKAGYQHGHDFVVDITGYSGEFTLENFVTIG